MLQHFLSNIFNKTLSMKSGSVRASLLLCFLFVFVQSASLVHSHDGDLQTQFDCTICLKVNGSDHAIPAVLFDFVVVSAAPQIDVADFETSVPTRPSFRARAPPLSA